MQIFVKSRVGKTIALGRPNDTIDDVVLRADWEESINAECRHMNLNVEMIGFRDACKYHNCGNFMRIAEVPDCFDQNRGERFGRGDVAASKMTPVEKVTELMKKLSAQIIVEGKKDAGYKQTDTKRSPTR